jgi:hypothetical protein
VIKKEKEVKQKKWVKLSLTGQSEYYKSFSGFGCECDATRLEKSKSNNIEIFF